MIKYRVAIWIMMIAVTSTYELKCPDEAQWHLRAINSCSVDHSYVCLLELYGQIQFKEECSGPDKSEPGTKLVFQPYFNLAKCSLNRYQPFTFSTIHNSDCAYLKSICNEEGQLRFHNNNFTSDATCRCDYTRGYIFIRKPINTCFCVPSEEDCSCYKSNCKHVLSDYTCLTEDSSSISSKCSDMDDTQSSVKNLTKTLSGFVNTQTGNRNILPIVIGIHTLLIVGLLAVFLLVNTFYHLEKSRSEHVPEIETNNENSDHLEKSKSEHEPESVSDIENSDHLEKSRSEHVPEIASNIENSDIPDEIKMMKEDDIRLYHEVIKSGDIAIRHFFRVIIIGKENAGKTSLTEKLLWERPDNVMKLHNKNEIDIHRKQCTLSVNDGSWLPSNHEPERECVQKLQIALENRKNGSPEIFALDKDMQYFLDATTVDRTDLCSEILTSTKGEMLLNEKHSSDLQSTEDHIDCITDDEQPLMNIKNTMSYSGLKGPESRNNTLSCTSLKSSESTQKKDDKENLDADLPRVDEFKKLLENVHSDLLENTTKENNETKNKDMVSFSLWDFAGDSEFCGTFQAFLSSCAVYLLVVNALEDINTSKSNSSDYINRWFNIFHCFCSALKNTKDKGEICKTQNPPVIAVCTNIDRLQSEELEKKTKTFREELCNIARNASSENTGTLRQVFFCSTTSDDNETFDEIRKEIAKHIKRLPGWGVKVPVRWVVLEEFLRKLKANGTFILQLQDLREIARDERIGISNYKELVLFLHFNHEVGNIIYFADDDLEDYVILDPKWLAQALRCVMTDRNELSVEVMATKDFQKLQVTGEMSDLIISELLSSNQNYNFATHKSYLLKVMNKFDILMKYRNKELKDVLYMPSMIQDINWQNVCTYFATEKYKKTSWLCFEFDFLPPSFFNHILCIFIRKYEVSMYMLENKQMSAISQTFGLFDLDTSSRELAVLCTFQNIIAIQLWTHTDTKMDPLNEAENLRKSLQYYISKVSTKYRLHVDYNIYPKCRNGDFTQSGKRVFSELEKLSQYKCLEHNAMHDTDDVYLPWYPDQKLHQNKILPDKVIVAAIDFGTANSGYAYCNKSDFKESGFDAEIYCNHWKIHGKVRYKSPTSVLFKPDKTFHSFGFEAEQFYHDNSGSIDFTKWYFFRNFKMLLYKDLITKETFISDIRNAGKDMLAVDVFGAVINYFKNHLLNDLTIPTNQNFDNEYVHWVITVPAIWDSEARHFMEEAAKKANIKPDQLTIVPEPEAASFYCRTVPTAVQSSSDGYKQIALMQKGSQYIVLDQGGGTTDIIVHEVKGPDALQEIHHPFGGCYGGNTVNEQFVSFLDILFGKDVVQHIRKDYPSDYFDLLSEFENKKTSVSGENSDDISVRLPLKWLDCFEKKNGRSISEEVKNPTLKEKVSFRRDKMRIKHDVFLSFFEYSIKKVLEILEKLFEKPHIRNIDLLLAVGGYCESIFLINAIRQRFPKLNVIQPKDPSLAVLKGAVLYGFRSHTVNRLGSKDC